MFALAGLSLAAALGAAAPQPVAEVVTRIPPAMIRRADVVGCTAFTAHPGGYAPLWVVWDHGHEWMRVRTGSRAMAADECALHPGGVVAVRPPTL